MLEKYKPPATNQILTCLMQVGGNISYSDIHNLKYKRQQKGRFVKFIEESENWKIFMILEEKFMKCIRILLSIHLKA
jgi:hypothetical protein